MGLSTAIEGNGFLQGDFDSPEVILKGILQVKSMSDLGMDVEEMPNHPSDFMFEGIRFNEYFMGSEPVNDWGGINFVRLDAFNCLQTAKNATNHHCLVLSWLGRGGVYEEISLELIFRGWEIIM